jgi:glycosyltransferase involved in cell wall biosynthesis
MKISFWHRTNKPFKGEKLFETPFGGAEMQAFNLAKALSTKGYDVITYCNVEQDFVDGSFMLRHYDKVKEDDHQIFICVRADDILDPRYSGKYFKEYPGTMILWTGDDNTQSNNSILTDPITRKILDKIVVKSHWQKITFVNDYFLKENEIMVIRNGVNDDYFDSNPLSGEGVRTNKFIYASTVYRGADRFIYIWPKIRELIPHATLDVYMSTNLYLPNNPYDLAFKNVFDDLRKLDGITLHDPVCQSELIKEIRSSYLMLYPNYIFLETAPNVVSESVAVGTPVITSWRGGLPEIVGAGGICIEEDPGTNEYVGEFVRVVYNLHTDFDRWSVFSELGMEEYYNYRMSKISDKWIELFHELENK